MLFIAKVLRFQDFKEKKVGGPGRLENEWKMRRTQCKGMQRLVGVLIPKDGPTTACLS